MKAAAQDAGLQTDNRTCAKGYGLPALTAHVLLSVLSM